MNKLQWMVVIDKCCYDVILNQTYHICKIRVEIQKLEEVKVKSLHLLNDHIASLICVNCST